MEKGLRLENISKRYGTMTAVDSLTLTVPSGIVFGLLGPNGAGKTTTLEIIEGLRRPDEGHVWWNDMDVTRNPEHARSHFGMQLQTSAFFELLTVKETLELFHSLYRKRLSVGDLIERLDLTEKQNARVGGLSGGQQQRLALACALINDPEVVFLDEPSAGLDPQARRTLWDVILGLKSEGRTVVLTTHYMEEAEQLCDRLVIMDHGRFAAEGSPRELIGRYSTREVVELRFATHDDQTEALSLAPMAQRIEALPDRLLLYSDEGDAILTEAHRRGYAPVSGLVRRSTLEDVFLRLTGRTLVD